MEGKAELSPGVRVESSGRKLHPKHQDVGRTHKGFLVWSEETRMWFWKVGPGGMGNTEYLLPTNPKRGEGVDKDVKPI